MTPTWLPALDNPHLIAPSVADAISDLSRERPVSAAQIRVAQINPDLADTQALTDAWDIRLYDSVNCVIVAGRRNGSEKIAACCIRATTRADINHTIKRRLDVRKCSFLHMEDAVAKTGMEYGGITPIGLDSSWPIWLDPLVIHGPAIIGSGLRTSKLRLPGAILALFPGVEIVTGLAQELREEQPAPATR